MQRLAETIEGKILSRGVIIVKDHLKVTDLNAAEGADVVKGAIVAGAIQGDGAIIR